MSPSQVLLSAALTRELIIHRVPDQPRKLAEMIRALTLDHEPPRDAVPVDDREDLWAALHLDRRDGERAEKTLVKLQILRVVWGGGRWWYELLPLPDQWPDRPAGRKTKEGGYSSRAPSLEAMERARDAWLRLASAPLETNQSELDLRLTAEQRFADRGQAQAEAAGNRARALRREEDRELRASAPASGNCVPTLRENHDRELRANAPAGLGEFPPKPKLSELVAREFGGISPKPTPENHEVGGNSPNANGGISPALQTPARTRARHDHVPTSVPQSMVHDHEHARSVATEEDPLRGLSYQELERRLDADALYQLERLDELCGGMSATFYHTWLLRLNDRFAGAAKRAIAHCASEAAAGRKPNKGWGEAANYWFNQWRFSQVKTGRVGLKELHEQDEREREAARETEG